MINVTMYITGGTSARQTYTSPVEVQQTGALGLRDITAIWENPTIREDIIDNAIESAYDGGRLEAYDGGIS